MLLQLASILSHLLNNNTKLTSNLETIGRKRTLLVLLQLREHKKLRNKEIAKNLGGISSSTLSSILKQLQKQGLISRKINGEFPPLTVEYSLTKNGISLLQAIDPFLEWLRKT